MEVFRRTLAEINLDHLRHNWHIVRGIAGEGRFICPMVKANAYGHGDAGVARVLEQEGADAVGVCLIEEALSLRSAGFEKNILVFRGFDRRGAEVMLDNQLTPIISDWSHLEALEAVASEPVKVHLKFNTGMSRLGFDVNESEKLFAYFSNSKKLKLKAILTHLACGDDAHLVNGVSANQLKKMNEVVDYFKPFNIFVHTLNTSGILSLQHVQQNHLPHPTLTDVKWGFRPGIMLYGYTTWSAGPQTLKPVMSFRSVIDTVRTVEKGETVSYGGTWQAHRPSVVGIVPVGYADGVHRLVSNRSRLMVAGQAVPLIGRVCMDFIMLDLTDLPQATKPASLIHEEVTLFGYTQNDELFSADLMAEQAETISYEILTSVSSRVPRQNKGLNHI